MDKQIIHYYQRGVASYLIAKKFGVSNAYVRRLLKRSGVKLRGHNVTNKLSADKRTPEENRAITRAASQANRGSTHSDSHRVKLAISREKNPVIDPVYEQVLVDLCTKHGIGVVPQKAFYKYNVDLYLVKENVVIEVFGGGFHNKKEAVDMFNNKLKYLSSRKIPVVIVWTDKHNFNPRAVLQSAMSVHKQLTILTGEGKPSIRGLGDITTC